MRHLLKFASAKFRFGEVPGLPKKFSKIFEEDLASPEKGWFTFESDFLRQLSKIIKFFRHFLRTVLYDLDQLSRNSHVALSEERVGRSCCTCSPRTPNPVNVVFNLSRHIIINHMPDVLDIYNSHQEHLPRPLEATSVAISV